MNMSRQSREKEGKKATVCCGTINRNENVMDDNKIKSSSGNNNETSQSQPENSLKNADNDKQVVFELLQIIRDNPDDEQAKEKLVLKYEGLVHSLAGKYSRMQENHEDLVQVGLIGLLIAAQRFDPNF